MLPYTPKRASNLLRIFPISLALIGLLAGCAEFPNDGPLASDIVNQQSDTNAAGTNPFAIVSLNLQVVEQLTANSANSLQSAFGEKAAQDAGNIQAGDYVIATIWDGVAAPLSTR